MTSRFLATVLLCSFASPGGAATMSAVADAQQSFHRFAQVACYNSGSVGSSDECVETPVSLFGADSEDRGDVATTARAGINMATGEITGGASATATQASPTGARFPEGKASFAVTLDESFTVSGTGTLTARLSYSARIKGDFYDTVFDDTAHVYMSGYVSAGFPGVQQSYNFSETDDGLNSGMVTTAFDFIHTDMVTQTVAVTDGTTGRVSFGLNGSLSDLGEITLLHAVASLQMSDGVTITPSDPLFLSAPASVPLPAGVWLLGAGLGGLGLLCRRA